MNENNQNELSQPRPVVSRLGRRVAVYLLPALLVTLILGAVVSGLWHSGQSVPSEPPSLLVRQTQKMFGSPLIPSRLFAIDYLARSSTNTPGLIKEFEGTLLEATHDGDEELRVGALSLLAAQRHPLLAERAAAQLTDADSFMRLLGLHYLRQNGSAKRVPDLIPLLNDPEIPVVTAATDLLGEWTGQKSEVLELGETVHRWKLWWGQHETEFPKPQAVSGSVPRPWRLPARDFTLPDSDGRPVRLSDYRSKVVLLGIINPVTGAGLPDLLALRNLQKQHSNDLVVVSVFVDTETVARAHGHVHGPDGQCHSPASDPATVQAQLVKLQTAVQSVAQASQLSHTRLLDVDGAVPRRFGARVLPTYVILDGRGDIRRRFCGSRPESVLSAMLEEIMDDGFMSSARSQ